MTEKSAADRVLELDEQATGEPWHLFNRRGTLQISSSTDHGHHDAIVFWCGFEASDLPHRKQVANAKLIHEYRQLAPALARQVKALEAERGWRPIETAPKDGKVLLVFQGGAACSGEWRYGRPGEPQQDVLSWRSDCCGRFSTPIGWKPLLEPPK